MRTADIIFWESRFEIVMRGSVSGFSHCLKLPPGLIMGVEFTAQRKGVSSWAGPEAGLEMGMRLLHLCTQKRDSSHSSRRGCAGGVAGLEGAGAQNALGAVPVNP